MVEPLRRVAVAHRAAELDAPVRVQQPRAHDPDVIAAPRRVLERREPAGACLDIRVENDHVALGVGRAQSAVDVGREAVVVLPLDDLDPRDRAQCGDVLGTAGVVADDDPGHSRRDGSLDAARRVSPRARRRGSRGPRCPQRPPSCRYQLRIASSARSGPCWLRRFRRRRSGVDAKRQRDRAEQQRAPAVVAVGQVDATAQAAEGPLEHQLVRGLLTRPRLRRSRLVVHRIAFGSSGPRCVATGMRGSKPPRRSSESRRRAEGGRRSAREPRIAPVVRSA